MEAPTRHRTSLGNPESNTAWLQYTEYTTGKQLPPTQHENGVLGEQSVGVSTSTSTAPPMLNSEMGQADARRKTSSCGPRRVASATYMCMCVPIHDDEQDPEPGTRVADQISSCHDSVRYAVLPLASWDDSAQDGFRRDTMKEESLGLSVVCPYRKQQQAYCQGGLVLPLKAELLPTKCSLTSECLCCGSQDRNYIYIRCAAYNEGGMRDKQQVNTGALWWWIHPAPLCTAEPAHI
ncbi:hypothetical protein B0H63DRAFT_100885 [Podospora didyma]|uniref:Uncharacterized protein n=1 Tax=Podospora didyma TaxID=330526 RepID=A0AAE0U3D7_9PEZI|nr:hypothetical protein B0H63DRAFT_100885 [Podospora didyma]